MQESCSIHPYIQAHMYAWHRVGAQLTFEFQKVLGLIVKSHGRLQTNTSQVDYDLSNAWTLTTTTKVKHNTHELICPPKYPGRLDEMGRVTEE